MSEVVYELTFKGAASDTLARTFDDCAVDHRHGVTVLRCVIRDQPALHGVIGRIQSLGLELLEIRRLANEEVS